MNHEAKKKLTPLQLELIGAAKALHAQFGKCDAPTLANCVGIEVQRCERQLELLVEKHFLQTYFQDTYYRPTDLSFMHEEDLTIRIPF